MSNHRTNSNSLYTDISYAYWNDICDAQPLPSDEQKRLFKLIKAGDNIAKEKLVESFLRLVVSRAKMYCHDFDTFMDLIQEGNIGLLRAVENFEPDKGCCFSTYAINWIDKYIRKESCRTGAPVHIPNNACHLVNRLSAVEKLFIQENSREPSIEELAQILNLNPEKVLELQRVTKPSLSLDQELPNSASKSLINKITSSAAPSPEEIILAKDTKTFLEELMQNTLTPSELSVLRARFGLNEKGSTETLKALSDKQGITKEGVRKIEQRALQKLHKALLKSGLTQVDLLP